MAWQPPPVWTQKHDERLQMALRHPKWNLESQPGLTLNNSTFDQTTDRRNSARRSLGNFLLIGLKLCPTGKCARHFGYICRHHPIPVFPVGLVPGTIGADHEMPGHVHTYFGLVYSRCRGSLWDLSRKVGPL